LEKTGKR